MMSQNAANEIIVKLYNPFVELELVKEIWTSMLKKCPHAYFLSWAWRELWIQSLPPDSKLYLVAGFINESPVMTFFVGSRTIIKHRCFKLRELSLNETLIPDIDIGTYIEYNSILIDPRITISLESVLKLIPIKWDKFNMLRCSSIYQPNLLSIDNIGKNYYSNIMNLRSYYVNLDKVRHNSNDYLSLISPKKRYQVRRSIKEYEKIGKLEIHVANNKEDGLEIFAELIRLHQKRWTGQERSSSFSYAYFDEFHRSLISKRFQHQEIQLMRISAGNHILGCLYSFIYDSKVLGCLCGFNYLPGHLYSPGLICHYFAILYNAEKGLSSYDFLEGSEDYKKSLSTDFNEMQNVVIRKRDLNYVIQRTIVKLSRFYNKIKDGELR